MREVKLDFAERDICKPVLLRLSLAGNLEKPIYGTERREPGYGLRRFSTGSFKPRSCEG
jgi:hypothetical protein